MITLAVLAIRRDSAYGLVIIWALTGIAVNQSGNPEVVTTAEISAIITVIAIIVVGLVSKFKRTD